MIYKNSNRYMKKSINIFGAGELFKQLEPILNNEKIGIANVFDDTLNCSSNNIEKYICEENINKDLLYCVGYKNMKMRYERFKEIKNKGFDFVSLIIDNAIISDKSTVGNGTIINQGVIVDNFVNIGECVFVNIGSTISHHTNIKDNVFIAPGVNIAGYVTVNEGVFIGTNATIIDHINIGKYSVIAAGAVVIEDVPPYCMVAGNPAVVKKRLKY